MRHRALNDDVGNAGERPARRLASVESRALLACLILVLIVTTSAASSLAVDIASGGPSAAPVVTPGPDDIYHNAMLATRALPVPAYVVYDLHVVENGMTITKTKKPDGSVQSAFDFDKRSADKHFHVSYRVSDDAAVMVDTGSGQSMIGAPVPMPIVASSAISPFVKKASVVGRDATATPVPTSISPSPNVAEKVIGEVFVDSSRFYRVTSAGVSDEAGRTTYHLLLQARTSPADHPLTDLYVDAQSYRVVRAVAAYAASVGINGYKATVSIDFSASGPYWVVTDGKIEGSAHVLFEHASGSYVFEVENPTFPEHLPDADFTAPTAAPTPRTGAYRVSYHARRDGAIPVSLRV